MAIPYLPVHEATLHSLCGWEFMLSSNAAYFVAFLDPPFLANCFCKNVFQNYSEASFSISINSKLYNIVRRRTFNWLFGSTACPLVVRTDSGVSHTTSTQPPFFPFWYFLWGLCLPEIWINFWHDVTVQLTIAACHPLTFLQSFIAWYLRMHFMHPSF